MCWTNQAQYKSAGQIWHKYYGQQDSKTEKNKIKTYHLQHYEVEQNIP